GVEQRDALRQKGYHPHMLVMTATPIPRTLALTLYGDLDVSVIDELPPGRQKVITRWRTGARRPEANTLIAHQVAEGHQAFIICPLIEESETLAVKAATVEYERLSREVFPNLRLGLLHGSMKPAEKDATMRRFRDHELDVLVATSVIEVGIDVPNATVMVIEDADRFGLSQLHQFRGRVGRGKDQAYCYVLSASASIQAQERLEVFQSTDDGFRLAEEDLRLRGPGDFIGARQNMDHCAKECTCSGRVLWRIDHFFLLCLFTKLSILLLRGTLSIQVSYCTSLTQVTTKHFSCTAQRLRSSVVPGNKPNQR